MTETTETTDESSATAVDDARSVDNVPPFVIPRDRRKYTRYLAPPFDGPGLQLFESPEHEALGDGLTFYDADNNAFTQSPPDTNYFKTQGGQLLSFGQIVALAGDFYGLPNQPISDGATPADQQTRFQDAFNTLYTEAKNAAGTYQAQSILAVMQSQSTAVANKTAQILAADPTAQDASSQAYSQTNSGHEFDSAYNIASGAVPTTPWYFSQGSYLALAATNWDHFGANAKASYVAGHTLAVQAAANGSDELAYMLEAFACHFLTDLFSSGHLRTPRKALSTSISASLCSQLMHDEDCYNGLVVQDANANTWIAYGDKRLVDPVNQTNYARARKAVNVSLGEVIGALQSRKNAAAFAALDMIPSLDVVTNALDKRNWSPLYVLANGAPKVRDRLGDLRCRVWTSTFSYASTYWRMDSGGVHSPGGAPPGQATALAHSVTWQNHHITSSSEHDLAPAATLVTNWNPNAINNLPPGSFGGPIPPFYLEQPQQNTLVVAFRKTSSDGSNHHLHYIPIPMSDAPAFKTYTPSEFAIGSNPSQTVNGGDPAMVAWPGAAFMVFASSNGTLYQGTWLATTRFWSTQTGAPLEIALTTADSGTYQLLAPGSGDAQPRVALCYFNGSNLYAGNDGEIQPVETFLSGLYMAFPARSVPNSSGNIVFCSWNGQGAFGTPKPVAYTVNGGPAVYPKTSLSVSLIEFGGALLLAFADSANNNAIRVLRYAGGNTTWTQLTAAVKSANGNPVTTHSALSLVAYGGAVVLVVNDSNGNIYTHGYDPTANRWIDYLIQGSTNGNGASAPLQTKYGLSAVGFGGDAYIVFIDKASGTPSIMTTATST
jgi:hypothetical protein